ncbi:MAG: hypothetical protein QOJ02_2822 [Acidobacteriota bacterium]|nr:hypothetical protein [Acidobacteriota bacterium]
MRSGKGTIHQVVGDSCPIEDLSSIFLAIKLDTSCGQYLNSSLCCFDCPDALRLFCFGKTAQFVKFRQGFDGREGVQVKVE